MLGYKYRIDLTVAQPRRDRIEFAMGTLKIALALAIGHGAALIGAGVARAEDSALLYNGGDRQERLIEGARREGEVTLYSSMIVNQTQRPIAEAFGRKYPFLKMSYWRAESAGIFAKLSAESRAGNLVADLVEGTGVGEVAVEAGLAEPYFTPEVDAIPSIYRDANGVWTATRRSFFSAAYNTRLVAPEATPKRYEDLLDPRWKGRIAWHIGSSSGADLFVTNLRLSWGEERARTYLMQLAQQKPVSISGASARALVDRVIAGEYAIALNIFAHHPLISHAKGAPALPALMEPVATTVGTMIVPKGVHHPNAALLLADFILSAEGQAILAKADYFPTRVDTPSSPALSPITDALATTHEQFVSPDALVKYTPTSAAMIREIFQ